MGARRWLAAGVVAILVAGPGCVSCGSKGYGLALEAGPSCELPACQRDHVYVFAVSGLNPVSIFALDGLREQLNRQGYSKVATAQTVYAGWVAGEMRRVRARDPEAVFVLVGYESGGPTAVKLAEKMAAEGLPLRGVVLLDSEGKTPAPASGIRTLAVGSIYGTAPPPNVESAVVADVGWYRLPSDERTVAAVLGLLDDAAGRIPVPVTDEPAAWDYPHAPPMRPAGDPVRSPDWIYLFDHDGGSTQLRGPASPVAPTRGTPVTATRVPVTGSVKMPE